MALWDSETQSEMVRVYPASNGIEAQLLYELCHQEGIRAEIEGGNLQGGVGEIQPQGIIHLVVPANDAEAARALIARWQDGEFSL